MTDSFVFNIDYIYPIQMQFFISLINLEVCLALEKTYNLDQKKSKTYQIIFNKF